MLIGFEWDDEKAATNIRDHEGVAFEQAATAFNDTFAVEWIDERGIMARNAASSLA